MDLMSTDVTLENRLPTPQEHRRLAEAVGWAHAFDWPSQPASLAGSTLGSSRSTPTARPSAWPGWSATA